MIKITAAAAALAALTTGSALAATAGVVNPGLYTVTLEYTNVTNDSGICGGAGVTIGAFTTGVASVFGAGKTLHTIVPTPGAATTATPPTAPGVSNLTCDYSALPAKLGNTGAPPASGVSYTGTVLCTASAVALLGGASASYTITQGGGSSTVNQIVNKGTVATYGSVFTNNSFHITSSNVTVTATAPSSIAGLGCTLSTDALFVRTGS